MSNEMIETAERAVSEFRREVSAMTADALDLLAIERRVPLELRLGIVEGAYTPRVARILTKAVALMPEAEAEDLGLLDSHSATSTAGGFGTMRGRSLLAEARTPA